MNQDIKLSNFPEEKDEDNGILFYGETSESRGTGF